jgi:ankyrin repeat protein
LKPQGLRPEQCNDSEKTALHAAAQQGTLEACRALLAAATSEVLIKSQELRGDLEVSGIGVGVDPNHPSQ